jgi:hypothetical protein
MEGDNNEMKKCEGIGVMRLIGSEKAQYINLRENGRRRHKEDAQLPQGLSGPRAEAR